MRTNSKFRLPAEWEEHEAVFLAWPNIEEDPSGKFLTVAWSFAELVRVLSSYELVRVLCDSEASCEIAARAIALAGATGRFELHAAPHTHCWIRDTGPTGVIFEDGEPAWIEWGFSRWGRSESKGCEGGFAEDVSRVSGKRLFQAAVNGEPLALEGGVFDGDGEGTLLASEECLLSGANVRNAGMSRENYEAAFATFLGVEKTLWIKGRFPGDDTGGHLDFFARWVGPYTVALVRPGSEEDEKELCFRENLNVLSQASDAKGRKIEVITLPMPDPSFFSGERLPASYANFYFANGCLLVPLFNDRHDLEALNTLAAALPGRTVQGVFMRDLLVGGGAVHCLTQQQPKAEGAQ